MNKKLVYALIVIVALAAFFYPKERGNRGTSREATYTQCDCRCVHYDLEGKLVPCE